MIRTRAVPERTLDVAERHADRDPPRVLDVRPAGFTLLEVILALALFVVIMGAVAAAIRLYYVNLTQSQKTLELTALARGTVNLVAGDLRSAIQFKPVDVSGLNELISSNAAALLGAGGGSAAGGTGTGGAGSGSDQDTGDPSGDSGGSPSDGGSSSGSASGGDSGGISAAGQSGNSAQGGSSSSGTSTADDSEDPPIDRPILFGSSNQLVVDISRLPRIDQYHPVLHTSEVGSYLTLPTDLKSVSYFVSFDTAGGKFNGGLFRREVDRVSLRQAGLATAFQVDAAAREIAPEVVEIAFRYFDGESWQSEWDSDTQGGFPSAIEFVMILDPSRLRGGAAENYEYRGYDAKTMRTFRCVTHLPIAEILTAEQQELAQDRSGGLSSAENAAAESGEEATNGAAGNNNSNGGNAEGGAGGGSGDGNNSGGQNPPPLSGGMNGGTGGAPSNTGGNGPGRGGQGGGNGGQGTGNGSQGPGRGGAPGSGSGGQPGGGRGGGGPGNSRGTP